MLGSSECSAWESPTINVSTLDASIREFESNWWSVALLLANAIGLMITSISKTMSIDFLRNVSMSAFIINKVAVSAKGE